MMRIIIDQFACQLEVISNIKDHRSRELLDSSLICFINSVFIIEHGLATSLPTYLLRFFTFFFFTYTLYNIRILLKDILIANMQRKQQWQNSRHPGSILHQQVPFHTHHHFYHSPNSLNRFPICVGRGVLQAISNMI